MKLCRFTTPHQPPQVGLLRENDSVVNLSAAGFPDLSKLFEDQDLPGRLRALSQTKLPHYALSEVHLLAPIDRQEVWAAGVTYLRSKTARMEESDFSANAYDRVYLAERPELFFKSLPTKVVGPGKPVGIRQDARWSVPEPELVLITNSAGQLVGCTLGNDMSSRDIEGENLLYLPQAKIYRGSCALGPYVVVGASEAEIRSWSIRVEIHRGSQNVFSGETSVGQIKRTFAELIGFLFRSQQFPDGAYLFTGTGVVPPESFTLEEGDRVRLEISGIGVLDNPVIRV